MLLFLMDRLRLIKVDPFPRLSARCAPGMTISSAKDLPLLTSQQPLQCGVRRHTGLAPEIG